LQDELR